MKPAFAIEEYARRRLKFFCGIAARLPKRIVAPARVAKMKVVFAAMSVPLFRKGSVTRIAIAKPEALDAIERKAVVGVGAPW